MEIRYYKGIKHGKEAMLSHLEIAVELGISDSGANRRIQEAKDAGIKDDDIFEHLMATNKTIVYTTDAAKIRHEEMLSSRNKKGIDGFLFRVAM